MNNMSGRGHILDSDEILERLHQGEIFLEGSWSSSCLRAASYDLRMSEDLLVVPGGEKYPTGRFYKRGERRLTDVILHPGDVAFVSTTEKICMPWDINGSVGHKFSLASRGLIILTGMFIDPGFGLQKETDGTWVAAADERLHFLIANVGSTEVSLKPGQERIASIQFTEINEVKNKNAVKSTGFSIIEQEYLTDQGTHGAGLVFFRNMADLKNEFEDLKKTVQGFKQRLLAIESGSNQIVMFGLYLVCVTFIGIALAATLSIIQNHEISSRLNTIISVINTNWRGATVFFFAIIGIIWIGWKLFSGILQLSTILITRFAQNKKAP